MLHCLFYHSQRFSTYRGQKQNSRSYKYKLRFIITKKVANPMSKIFLCCHLYFRTETLLNSVRYSAKTKKQILPKSVRHLNQQIQRKPNDIVGKFSPKVPSTKDIRCLNPKFYILNSINNQKENSSSGGVEAIIKKAT